MRTWRLPPDVDTDQLAPGHAMKDGRIEVVARHCLEAVRPEFPHRVREGDVVVAGANFGIGSSREQAATVLVHLGVAAVIAPSYSGLFLRNAFNVGLLLLTCPRALDIADGVPLGFDARAGKIALNGGVTLDTEPIPGFLLERIAAGGLLAELKRRFAASPNGPAG
ncbi:MAG: 3-isopropylmalate dehydratase [Rubrivivax sp.]|nr:3-isopropylmalate dehydratase [Rubrivivax sp.]